MDTIIVSRVPHAYRDEIKKHFELFSYAHRLVRHNSFVDLILLSITKHECCYNHLSWFDKLGIVETNQ